jgi:hypothetical protein
MPLYPKNSSPAIDPALFANPTAEYRGTPFWSWNCKLDRARLLRQIEHLKAMGMGGFHIHSRVGLATEYLGEEFLGHVRACVEKAKSENMLAWLYDEDRWPSGSAGGLVTKEARFRQKHLLMTVDAAPAGRDQLGQPGEPALLGRYAVAIADGCLSSYRRLKPDEQQQEGERLWHAFLRTSIRSSWYNNYTYVDTLSKPAIDKFIALTHERYHAAVGAEFGRTIPSIFTDEPQFQPYDPPCRASDIEDLVLSWTDDLAATYQAAWKEDILDFLPELFWELPDGKPSRARWRWHDHHTERFSSAFADTIGAWCDQHGILFTGHMMEEPSLHTQTRMTGEAMRSYRGMSLPGIDMLCDNIELTTAKQAQSVARQYGRPGVMSELYGVTNWDFDFTGHKRQGDWQAALGITVRVPHLSWVSMAGEAKRDYPAAIDEHSPWYREYPIVENHFARLNVALTRGTPICRVGVIHPIESYWLCYGTVEKTRSERDARDQEFSDLIAWLLHGLVDFDYLCEGLLPAQQARPDGKTLAVGAMAYDVVIVPGLRTIRSTTLDRLQAFANAGGTLIFAGMIPDLVDAEPSGRGKELAEKCQRIAFSRPAILNAVEPVREVAVYGQDGALCERLLHQLRADGRNRTLFLCNTDRERPHGGTVCVRGHWNGHVLDTMSGQERPLRVTYHNERSEFHWDAPPAGHILLRLEPGAANATVPENAAMKWSERRVLADPVPVTLSEPNVLLLDIAEFRLDGGDWESAEEILRIDRTLRARIGIPLRGGEMAQPWVEPAQPYAHRAGLRVTLQCSVAVHGASLALEMAEGARISVDGVDVTRAPAGWWVDEAIQTVPLPDLEPGQHVIEVDTPFGAATRFEWMYLLGEFGVEVRGRHCRIIAPVRTLAFGDWTRQGLPFYAGNVTYHCRAQAAGQTLLSIPRFKAPLLTVSIDGKRRGPIAFPPYQIELGELADGAHDIDITAFGSRINAFGALHNCATRIWWHGPDAWHSAGSNWSYEYQLRPCGILTAPRLLEAQRLSGNESQGSTYSEKSLGH